MELRNRGVDGAKEGKEGLGGNSVEQGAGQPQEGLRFLRPREGSRGPQRGQLESTASPTCFLWDLGCIVGGKSTDRGSIQRGKSVCSTASLDPAGPCGHRKPFRSILGGLPSPERQEARSQPHWEHHTRGLFWERPGRFVEIFYSARKAFIVSSKPQKPKATNGPGKHSEVFEWTEKVNMEHDKRAFISPRSGSHPRGGLLASQSHQAFQKFIKATRSHEKHSR